MNEITTYLISQQTLFREGLCQCLENQSGLTVIGFSTSTDVLENIEEQLPNVIIVDLDSDPTQNLELSRKLRQRYPSVAIIMLAAVIEDSEVIKALKAQVAAYTNKGITGKQLADIISQVANGAHPINEYLNTRPVVAENVLREFQGSSLRTEADGLLSPLTSRETEVLQYVARGLLNKQIAFTLNISEQTIKNHVTSVLRKLNANARTEAVVQALKRGLISIA